MTPANYKYLSAFVRERSGLVLSDDKQYLIETRLLPVARKNGIGDLDQLTDALRRPGASSLTDAVVQAMTTNETFFFRDNTPFQNLTETVLPELMGTRSSRHLRIWCAAASTGQEPYSIAMAIKELGPTVAGWKFEIVGTDLSQEVLERAKVGTYSQFEVQRGLPVKYLLKYFTQIGDTWQINADIRNMVQYRPLNLLRDFGALGTFDIVFCRNVLIYFDKDTKADVLSRVSNQMASDGHLILGAAETVVGITDVFRPMSGKRGLYQVAGGLPASGAVKLKLATG